MICLLTERLVLEPPDARHIAEMRAITDDPDTHRYLGGPQSAADHFTRMARNAGSWQLYGYGGFAVTLRTSGATVGNVGVFHSWRGLGADVDDMPEAGWILGRQFVGQGLAREAVTAALGWFDEVHRGRPIFCMIDPDNAPSLALAAHFGFVPLRDAQLGTAPVRLLLRG
ncbi:GNAT family N-acetyltransferase [Croceibacterium sp. TMG7-5b_MA50]|uniref:GNAT family N-acetyltransferase n=1 Tax=Croceibacterium sp. TMG7-5b_MA50 TaxID=3121290 RepID=UPI0032219F0E